MSEMMTSPASALEASRLATFTALPTNCWSNSIVSPAWSPIPTRSRRSGSRSFWAAIFFRVATAQSSAADADSNTT